MGKISVISTLLAFIQAILKKQNKTKQHQIFFESWIWVKLLVRAHGASYVRIRLRIYQPNEHGVLAEEMALDTYVTLTT